MKNKLLGLFLVVALLAGSLFVPAVRSFAQVATTSFTNIRITNSATVGNDLSVTDNTAVGGDLTVTDDATALDLFFTTLNASRQTTITVTAGGTITPLGVDVPLNGTYATVGTSSIAGCTAGVTYNKIARLHVVGANGVTITDTNTVNLSGNAVLSTGDNLTLICNPGNGKWEQFGKTDN